MFSKYNLTLSVNETDRIKRLKFEDIVIADLVFRLKNKNDCLILFHGNDTLSFTYLDMVYNISTSLSGISFMCCNLNHEVKVDQLITRLSKNYTPQSWLTTDNIPFIVIFKAGWPYSYFKPNIEADTPSQSNTSLGTSSDKFKNLNPYSLEDLNTSLNTKPNTVINVKVTVGAIIDFINEFLQGKLKPVYTKQMYPLRNDQQNQTIDTKIELTDNKAYKTSLSIDGFDNDGFYIKPSSNETQDYSTLPSNSKAEESLSSQ